MDSSKYTSYQGAYSYDCCNWEREKFYEKLFIICDDNDI